ncbi:bifunctional precorrin-2 dehydrogenase/sirohydrochlorin ferrochelatase [Corallococcus sp. M34]|nr:bifunctional precorrin-2 dehydrogenase/sirohydrochlorin ferrochelatase [Citreicoccus inhibens]
MDYPVCLRLEDRPVLVVGGGPIAEGRVLALLDAGARVRLVSPEATIVLRQLAKAERLEWVRRRWIPGDTRGYALVLTAVDDPRVSQAVAYEARALGIWLNTADEPAACDFTLPSVGRRGAITVAVSSTGQSPALAAALRRELMTQVTDHHVRITRLSGWLRRRLPRGLTRQRLLKLLVDGDIGALLAQGQRRAAWARVREELNDREARRQTT